MMSAGPPVACALSPAELRARRELLLGELKAQVEETIPAGEGMRFRFPATDTTLAAIARVIEVERACCPFLRFTLTVEPDGGPVWLELSGPAGTRAFLEQELGL